jgi:inositol phosphorylceramide mannosyltransferase catalytic subunit
MEGFSAQPAMVHDSIAAMRARNPGWDYRFYDAAAAEKFILDVYGPDMFAAYSRIDPVYSAARSDLLRYLICYAHGGVYLDTKSTALLPLDDVLRPDDCFVFSQWKELRDLPAEQSSHAETRHIAGCEYVNWFVVSAVGHPFLRAVIERVLANISAYNPFVHGVGRHAVLRLTGPIAYTLAIHSIRSAHPHRYVRFETDIGFEYSIYGNPFSHRTQFGQHYSMATQPLILGNPLRRHATEILYGRITPFAERVRNKLARLAR